MSLAVHAFAESETLGRALAERLGAAFALVRTHVFPDGEVLPTVPEGADEVIVCRSLDRPNDKLVELLLAAEAWRRTGVRRLVLLAPYLAYMRQDTAFEPGQAISQTVVTGLLASAFDEVVTVDAHLHRTSSLDRLFAPTPARNLTAAPLIGAWLKDHGHGPDVLVLGPDEESEPLARGVAETLGAPWSTLVKTRLGDRKVELVLSSQEALEGRRVVLVDDICSTGRTLVGALELLRAYGAAVPQVVVVHALFDSVIEGRIRAAGAVGIVSTNSVPHRTNAVVLDGLLAAAFAPEPVR